jgi:hypothetical protein
MSYAMWKVVATMQGFYDQGLRERGEVFELLDVGEGGEYPPQVRVVAHKDSLGRIIENEVDEETVTAGDGTPLHRDYAEDTGGVPIRSGPLKGEVFNAGWMLRVPDSTPAGFYPPEAIERGLFWLDEARWSMNGGNGGERSKAPAPPAAQAATPRGRTHRPVRELP